MWGLSAESVMLSNGSILWHTHGKVSMTAFSPTLCDLKFEYFGWPKKITQVCNLSRARISTEIWNVFKKENNWEEKLFENKFVRFWYWCKDLTISVLQDCGVLFRSCVRSYGTVEKVSLDGNFWERLIREKINLWQLPAKREFLRMVDQGNLTSGSFWQNMEEFDCHTEWGGTSITFVIERLNKVFFACWENENITSPLL